VGFVELWHNGQRVLNRYAHATMYAGDGIYLKLGLYRSDTVQPVGVVFHDGFTQATQLEDVLPPASGPADGGTPAPDAGTPETDGGIVVTPTSPVPGTDSSGEPPFSEEPMRVGCSSAGGPLWMVALLGLGGLLRRFRRR
jgi:MYXO-CTERM domain-containing protein